MKLTSVFRFLLACTAGVLLAACSSSTPDPTVSSQTAPGSPWRPILSKQEAQYFTPASYFEPLSPQVSRWQPHTIVLPAQPDFIVGPPGTPDVAFTRIQDAVNAAIDKRSARRQYIAILPGSYTGTVYIPKAPGSLTLYGTGNSPLDTSINFSIDGSVSPELWRQVLNSAGEYQPGDPAWYMFQSCLDRQDIGVMCSAVLWSQNDGLQLQNLTIENSPGDSVDAGEHPAVALRTDGDRVQLNQVNLLSRQNTLLVTNSDIQNQPAEDTRQPRTLVTNSYVEGDIGIVTGRGALVFENSRFRIVNNRVKRGYVFAPTTLASVPYGFLVVNSQFFAPADSQSLLGNHFNGNDGQINGQVVIRDSLIDTGFNNTKPWGDETSSWLPFHGNTGSIQDGNLIRDLNDGQFNRMWEYNNIGSGSTPQVVPAP